MLTRIRNSSLIGSAKVNIPYTKSTLAISIILKQEGFINSFYIENKSVNFPYLVLNLKFRGLKKLPYITGLKRISKPGLRVYVSCNNIPRVWGGIGMAICFSLMICYILVFPIFVFGYVLCLL